MAAAADQLKSSQPAHGIARARCWVPLAVVAAHGPLLVVHLRHVWNRPHYCFALFLLPIVGWLMKQRWPHQQPYVPARWLERLLLGGSLVCLSLAIGIHSPYLVAVSAILAIGFTILHLTGLRAIPALFGTWMLLWLIVPPPLGFDLLLISRMQWLTSQLASQLLDLTGINHLMTGNILHLPGTTLFVDDACSGVHSLFALAGCTAVFAVMMRRTVRRGTLLLASSLGWAVLLNLFRVMSNAVALAWWEIDLTSGWLHDALGLVTFLFALMLMLSTDQWLHFAGYWISRISNYKWCERNDTGRLRTRPSSTRALSHLGAMRQREQSLWRQMSPSRTVRRMAIFAYGMLLATFVASWGHTGNTNWTNLSLNGFPSDFLPQSLGAWTQQNFESIERSASSPLGQSSRVWTYRFDQASDLQGTSCRISLDAPFSGWHELTRCYEGTGWQLEERVITPASGEDGARLIESRFTNSAGRSALLVFGLLTADGQPLTPTRGSRTARFVDRLRDESTVQVQGFWESDGPIDGQLQRELNAIVHTVMARTAAELQEQNGEDSSG